MLIDNQTIADVDRVARIFYIDGEFARRWNVHRRGTEKRLLTGWMWVSRADPERYRRSIKTMTAAYIDAWYVLVDGREAPSPGRHADRNGGSRGRKPDVDMDTGGDVDRRAA